VAIAFRSEVHGVTTGFGMTGPVGRTTDDLLVWIIQWFTTPSVPSGFTQAALVGSGSTQTYGVYWRIVTGSEPSTYTTDGGSLYAILCYSGVDTLNPIDATASVVGPFQSVLVSSPKTYPHEFDGKFIAVFGIAGSGIPEFDSIPAGMTSRAVLSGFGVAGSHPMVIADQDMGTALDTASPTGLAGAGAASAHSTISGYGTGVGILLQVANRAPSAPTNIRLDGAGNGMKADLSGAVVLTADYNDPDYNDRPAAIGIRRKVGVGAYEYWSVSGWTATSSATVGVSAPALTFTAGDWSNGTVYNVGVKYVDQRGATGVYSTDAVITGSAPPSVDILTPTGTVESSQPALTGTYSDIESDAMIGLEAAVFLAEDAPLGFDPSTASAIWRSGRIATDAISLNIGEDIGLGLHDGDYVVALRVFQEGELASLWATMPFTVDAPPVAVPSLVVTDAPEISSVRIAAVLPSNQLSTLEALLVHGVDGWVPGNGNTATPTGLEGVGMQVTATGPDEIVIQLDRSLATIPNGVYSEYAEVALPTGSDVGTWHWEVEFFDSEGVIIDTQESDPVTEIVPVLAPEDPTDPGANPVGYDIGYDTLPTLANLRTLQGATIQGNVYIHLTVPASPAVAIDHVEWFHRPGDSGTWLSTPPGRLNDTAAPYDMGTPAVFVPDFGVAGQYGVRARVVYIDATDDDVIANFNTLIVQESTPVTISLVWDTDAAALDSAAASLVGPKPLAGATLSAASVDIRALVDVGTTGKAIDHVEWTWRPGTTGAWLTTTPGRTDDLLPPYDMGAPALAPSAFGATGQYSVRALVVFSDLTTQEATASFTTLVEAASILGARNSVDSRLLVDPNVLWVGTFDDADWKTKWGQSSTFPHSTNQVITTPTVVRPAYGKAMRITFQGPGSAENTAGVGWGIDMRPNFQTLGLPTTLDEAWLTYDFFLPSNFNYYAGGKLPGLAGNEDETAYTLPGGGDYFQTGWSGRIMWAHTTTTMVTYAYVYSIGSKLISTNINPNNGRLYGIEIPFQSGGVNILPRKGAWNTMELHYVMNTPGTGDGVWQAYLNNVQGVNLSNVMYRTAGHTGLHITHLFNSIFFGGPTSNQSTQQLEVDNYVISTERVGPRQ
jgi:hypothetical protein